MVCGQQTGAACQLKGQDDDLPQAHLRRRRAGVADALVRHVPARIAAHFGVNQGRISEVLNGLTHHGSETAARRVA